MPYFVYLLACADKSLYCGYTTDVEKRVQMHRDGKGSKYTRARLPVKLVYSEKFSLRRDALRREYAIKQLSRAQKLKLIQSTNKATN